MVQFGQNLPPTWEKFVLGFQKGIMLIYCIYSPVSNCRGEGSNKWKWVTFSKNNASKTKKCIGEGHKK